MQEHGWLKTFILPANPARLIVKVQFPDKVKRQTQPYFRSSFRYVIDKFDAKNFKFFVLPVFWVAEPHPLADDSLGNVACKHEILKAGNLKRPSGGKSRHSMVLDAGVTD